MKRLVLAFVVLLGLGALLVLGSRSYRAAAVSELPEDARPDAEQPSIAEATAEPASRRPLGGGESGEAPPPGETPLADNDFALIDLLRQVLAGWTEATAPGETPAVHLSDEASAALDALMRSTERAYRVVSLIREERFDPLLADYWNALPEPRPQAELVSGEAWWGAVIAMAFTCVTYANTEFTAETGIQADGRHYLEQVFAALPYVRTGGATPDEDPRGKLIDLLTRLLDVDGLLIDQSLFGTIVALREADPAHRDLYLRLLQRMGRHMDVAGVLETFGHFLGDRSDEGAYTEALRNLARHPELQDLVLSEARETLQTLSAENRVALGMAIAAHMDASGAARLFAEANVTEGMFGPLDQLGRRPEGTRALIDEYYALYEKDERPEVRAMLLQGVNSPKECLLFAEMDSDLTCRGEAIFSFTRWGEDPPPLEDQERALAILDECWSAENAPPQARVAGATGAAGRLLRRSDHAPVREQARAFLIKLAKDSTLPSGYRKNAIEQLEKYGALSEDELSALNAGL